MFSTFEVKLLYILNSQVQYACFDGIAIFQYQVHCRYLVQETTIDCSTSTNETLSIRNCAFTCTVLVHILRVESADATKVPVYVAKDPVGVNDKYNIDHVLLITLHHTEVHLACNVIL